MIAMQCVHAAIMQVVDMLTMADRGMAAVFAMDMSMIPVDLVPRHA